MAENKQAAKPGRPLSPHLQIYRPMLSMTMSIMHRATGVMLYAGSVLLVWWFAAAAHSDAYFDLVQAFFGHWFGRLVLFGFTWALIHHAIGGIRHFIWDTAAGLDPVARETIVKATLIGSVALTLVVWVVVGMK